MGDGMAHVHFIGLGGTGLSAIALVLLERGQKVSGSDRQASPVLSRLEQAGAKVMLTHQAENVRGADVVVRSSAVGDDNVEVLAARQAGIPVLKRSEYLGRFLENYRTIAIAGSHGKTTTTAMIAWMLHELGLDPSYVIGSMAMNLGSNAHAGKGEYFVIEADEYDSMFLGLSPWIAIVTNIEHDHPDCYPTPVDFYGAFVNFSNKIVPEGILAVNSDDPGAFKLAAEFSQTGRRSLLFGLDSQTADYRAAEISLNAFGGYDFKFYGCDGSELAHVALQAPGLHNVQNALAALCVADIMHLPLDQCARALSDFRGTGRRFEVRGELNGAVIIDDYAHHPSEIRATLSAARARYGDRRIWAVWQPHTYSRTRTLQAEFSSAFELADRVIVTGIYAAREAVPGDGFSAVNLAQGIRQEVKMAGKAVDLADGLDEAKKILLSQLKPGDVVLVLSAGDANRMSDELIGKPFETIV